MLSAFKKTHDYFIEDELIASLKDDNIKISDYAIKKARKGDDKEIFKIGLKYYENENYPKALTWFHKAALKENSDSQTWIGHMYQHGLSVSVNYHLAIEWYLKAKDSGNGLAMNNIGFLYFNGLGVSVDYMLAMEWYTQAASKENSSAQNNIGSMYQHGIGVSVDYKLAMKWYVRAANNGSTSAQHNVGYLYEHGLGTPVDYQLAMVLYLKAAGDGNDIARNNIGCMYRDGLGVSVDYKLAMYWFRKADEGGINQATSNIGWMYHNGYGVQTDYPVAISWYQKAIENGNIRVYTRIGFLYQNGLGVSKDLHYAFECFKKGATVTPDDYECQYQLAYFYEKEEAFQNKELAIKWYNKASDGGFKKAKIALKRLTEEEERKKRELQQNSSNKPSIDLTSDIAGNEPLSRDNYTVLAQIYGHEFSLLTEKFKALEQKFNLRMAEAEQVYQQKILERNKTAIERENKIRDLEEKLARYEMKASPSYQSEREKANNNTIPSININAIIKDSRQDLSYNIADTSHYVNLETLNVSDHEDATNDINYDSEVDSDLDSINQSNINNSGDKN